MSAFMVSEVEVLRRLVMAMGCLAEMMEEVRAILGSRELKKNGGGGLCEEWDRREEMGS